MLWIWTHQEQAGAAVEKRQFFPSNLEFGHTHPEPPMVLPLSALSITFSLAIASACPQQSNPLRELSSPWLNFLRRSLAPSKSFSLYFKLRCSKRLVSVSGPSLHRLTLRGSLEEIKTIIQVSMLRDSNRQTFKKLKCMHRPTFCKECRTWRKKFCSISLASKIRFYHPYPDIKLEKICPECQYLSIAESTISLLHIGLGAALWHKRCASIPSLGSSRQSSAGRSGIYCVSGEFKLKYWLNWYQWKFPEIIPCTGSCNRRPPRVWKCRGGFVVVPSCRLRRGGPQEPLHRALHAGETFWLVYILDEAKSNFTNSAYFPLFMNGKVLSIGF